MTETRPADELRAAAGRLRATTLRGGFLEAALVAAGDPLADWLDQTGKFAELYAQLAAAEGVPVEEPHPDAGVRHALAVAHALNHQEDAA